MPYRGGAFLNHPFFSLASGAAPNEIPSREISVVTGCESYHLTPRGIIGLRLEAGRWRGWLLSPDELPKWAPAWMFA